MLQTLHFLIICRSQKTGWMGWGQTSQSR